MYWAIISLFMWTAGSLLTWRAMMCLERTSNVLWSQGPYVMQALGGVCICRNWEVVRTFNAVKYQTHMTMRHCQVLFSKKFRLSAAQTFIILSLPPKHTALFLQCSAILCILIRMHRFWDSSFAFWQLVPLSHNCIFYKHYLETKYTVERSFKQEWAMYVLSP